jgi:hypothetical protein
MAVAGRVVSGSSAAADAPDIAMAFETHKNLQIASDGIICFIEYFNPNANCTAEKMNLISNCHNMSR